MEVVGGVRLIAALSMAAVMVAGAPAAAQRRWQAGTWVQVGITRTPFVADPVGERLPFGIGASQMTQAATASTCASPSVNR